MQFINSLKLNQIEQSIRGLSREEQLWLVERIIHNMRVSSLKNPSYITADSIEQQLANMANDPAVQAEIIAISQEFANTELDGLGE